MQIHFHFRLGFEIGFAKVPRDFWFDFCFVPGGVLESMRPLVFRPVFQGEGPRLERGKRNLKILFDFSIGDRAPPNPQKFR